ncbi:hypothetical protein OPV22_019513 [Ensete ventricosum]|uniref:Uncharacterized protein n=1 Tax=Ensete ventricosum TaxID=4639 RepID=A0AAV8PB79_ENSVE|nr:hypothetical protein OPV22_019513 [Ensete ventricosum]RWW00948.1 hypothetical protein GW17_00036048 [Ensete ventricosum]RZS08928.1 hypothetical protein BHM03_00039966 [Ensete ventricosum]
MSATVTPAPTTPPSSSAPPTLELVGSLALLLNSAIVIFTNLPRPLEDEPLVFDEEEEVESREDGRSLLICPMQPIRGDDTAMDMDPRRNRRLFLGREGKEAVVGILSFGVALFGVSFVGEGLKHQEGLKELMWWWRRRPWLPMRRCWPELRWEGMVEAIKKRALPLVNEENGIFGAAVTCHERLEPFFSPLFLRGKDSKEE